MIKNFITYLKNFYFCKLTVQCASEITLKFGLYKVMKFGGLFYGPPELYVDYTKVQMTLCTT